MDERARKAAAADASRKRPPSALAPSAEESAKRQKLEPDSAAAASVLASFDFSTLPAPLITELVLANLQAFSDQAIQTLVQTYLRSGRAQAAPQAPMQQPFSVASPKPAVAALPDAPAALMASVSDGVPGLSDDPQSATPPGGSAPMADSDDLPPGFGNVKEEPLDPLQMDIDEDELEYEPDKLNLEVRSRSVPYTSIYIGGC